MSTNYYLRTAETPADDECLHLGQWSAQGFTFRAHPNRGVMSYEAWLAQLDQGEIVSESGYTVSKDEMVETANRRGPAHNIHRKVHSDEFREGMHYFCTVEFC